MFNYSNFITTKREFFMKKSRKEFSVHTVGIVFAVLLFFSIWLIIFTFNEIEVNQKVHSLFLSLRIYLFFFVVSTALYIWEMAISIRLFARKKGVGFIVGKIFFVIVEMAYYSTIILYSFVFFVGIWSIYVKSRPIISMMIIVLIALTIVVVVYFLCSKIICLLLPKKQNLYIDNETIKKVGEFYKAIGAIVFIMSLSGGLVVGVFLPDYEPTYHEKIMLFCLTLSAIIFYSISDIINGLFNVNLLSEVNKKYDKLSSSNNISKEE